MVESAFGTGIRCSMQGICFRLAILVAWINFGGSIVSDLECCLGIFNTMPGIPDDGGS